MTGQGSKLRDVLRGENRDRFINVWRNGPMAADPALCASFLDEVSRLCETNKDDAAIYAELHRYYRESQERFDVCLAAGRDKRAQARLNQVAEILPPDYRPRNFLDVGCGDGLITGQLVRHFNLAKDRAFGIDLENPAPQDGFHFLSYDSDGRIHAADESFDFVTVLMVLHHAREPERMISDLVRVLSPEGYLVIRDHHTRDAKDAAFFAVMDEIFYTVFYPAPHLARDFSYRSKEEWVEAFADAGMAPIRVRELDPPNPFSSTLILMQKPALTG